MMRLISVAGLAALAFASPVGAAQTLEVIITGNGFFPIVSYLSPGDTVVFHNEAAAPVNVMANETNNSHSENGNVQTDWNTGDIDPGEFASVLVTEESFLAFEMFGMRWVGGEAQGEGSVQVTEEGTDPGDGDDDHHGHWEHYSARGEFTFDPVQLN